MTDPSPARRLARLAPCAALVVAVAGPWAALLWGLLTTDPAGAPVAAGVLLAVALEAAALALTTAGHALLRCVLAHRAPPVDRHPSQRKAVPNDYPSHR